MYCNDICVDADNIGTCGKALQDEGFGIYVGYTVSPTTSGSG